MQIISCIIGGLGNQMFQYAAGLAVAKRLGYIHYLDITSFKRCNTHYGFELYKVFNCSSRLANKSEIDKLIGSSYKYFRNTKIEPIFKWTMQKKTFIREPHFHYWPEINEINEEAYLLGYWQSDKYFYDIADQIKHEYTFKNNLTEQNKDIFDLISDCMSVNVHVRRGDYISNPKNDKVHGTCSVSYYKNAAQYLYEHIKNPVFFVFSDDPEWAKKNIFFPSKVYYLNHNQGSYSHYDLQLMSHCKHHIIANSSFSWWGAWLSQYAEKLVIAPKQWFANDKNQTQDLFPNSWIQME